MSRDNAHQILRHAENGLQFDYKINESSIPPIDDQTTFVPVTFSGQANPFFDCCVMRNENGNWRVNLNSRVNNDREPVYSLIDYRNVNMDQQKNGVTIKPKQVVRFTKTMWICLDVTNGNTKGALFWGRWGNTRLAAQVFFGGRSTNIEISSTYGPGETSERCIRLGGYQATYPTRVKLNEFRFSQEGYLAFPDLSIPAWSYQFDLTYPP